MTRPADHSDQWDQVLDDHNDSVAALSAPDPMYVDDILNPEPVHDDGGPLWWLNGAAPATGSVMPDPHGDGTVGPMGLFQHVRSSFVEDLRSAMEYLARVAEELREVFSDLTEGLAEVFDGYENWKQDTPVRTPRPPRVLDTKVTHHSPRPPKPVTLHRRRTP